MSSSLDTRNRCRCSVETFGSSALKNILVERCFEPGLQPGLRLYGRHVRPQPAQHLHPSARGDSACLVNPGIAVADIGAGIHVEGTSPTSMPWNQGTSAPITVMG